MGQLGRPPIIGAHRSRSGRRYLAGAHHQCLFRYELAKACEEALAAHFDVVIRTDVLFRHYMRKQVIATYRGLHLAGESVTMSLRH